MRRVRYASRRIDCAHRRAPDRSFSLFFVSTYFDARTPARHGAEIVSTPHEKNQFFPPFFFFLFFFLAFLRGVQRAWAMAFKDLLSRSELCERETPVSHLFRSRVDRQ